MRCGDAFLMPAPGGRAIPHLWIAVTEPQPPSFRVVIVSVTTLRSGADQTVIIGKGEHPFIRHPSVVCFADSRIVDARDIEAQMTAGTVVRHSPCSLDLLRLIQDGLLASQLTPAKVATFFNRARRSAD